MKRRFQIIETYWKTIEVSAKTEEKTEAIAKQTAKGLYLGKNSGDDRSIEFALDIIPEGKPTLWDRLHMIIDETDVNWYQDMCPWQRKDLTKEELFAYAEEMRLALERIFDIAYDFELNCPK